jgi:hypothetical protein
MRLKIIAAMASAAAVLAIGTPSMAGTMVFNIEVTSATGVSDFAPFSFQETFTLAPSAATGGGPSFDYSGSFTDTGSPVTGALKSANDVTSGGSFLTYDFGGFSPVPSLHFLQADFFEDAFGSDGSYQQSISTNSSGVTPTSTDEAGLANYFALQGAMPWFEKTVDADFTTQVEYDGTATLVSASALVAGGVPEPAAWALMLLGFGTVGAALRRRENSALA